VQLIVQLYRGEWDANRSRADKGGFIREWILIPASGAKAYPDYVPVQIRRDYQEACLIVQPSPKASATMSRRCLQGMIRDFWEVSKPTLKKEIDEIQDKVDPDVWDAIESVRKVGNIGAHMEEDVNVIIEVEPDEAALLIWLIEYLMEQWYINREARRARLAELRELPAAKHALLEAAKAAPPPTEEASTAS
jgi:hypothetical protein